MGLVSTYCRSRWHGSVPVDAPQSLNEAIRRIDEIYNSGKPFFTKTSICAIYEQFQGSKSPGDKIFVRDVAGTMIEYTLRTGETFFWRLGSDSIEKEEERWLMFATRIFSLSRSEANLSQPATDFALPRPWAS